ncbi:MAG: DinB family protein [Segetibacter sp.]
MKQILKKYASYNVWANQKITETILTLSEETVKKTVVSSFSSIYLTLLHMWSAESIWWQWQKLAEIIQTTGNADSSIQEMAANLLAQSRQWKAWGREKHSGDSIASVYLLEF